MNPRSPHQPNAPSHDPSSSQSMTESPSSSPAAPRRGNRKNRHLVVPADTLLTFTRYHPRRDTEHASASNSTFRSHKRTVTTYRPAEHFVQANYRFAVDPDYPSGYEECTALSDARIPWQAVDVVFVTRTDACPICLQSFRAPRVTPCGHTFDYVCMLRHINISVEERQYTKCPLCTCRVRAEDLRPCAFRSQNVLEIGIPLQLRLVSREKGSMIPHAHENHHNSDIPQNVTAHSSCYSRIAFADKNFLLKLMKNSMKDLRAVLRDDPSLEPFVHDAMNNVRTKQNQIITRKNKPSSERSTTPSASSHKRELWYLYQSTDTQNIFLHPVNHRCLATELKNDFTNAPLQIEGSVLQIDRYTMDEHLRKRYRFLDHLPDGCEFALVELDLTSILSSETITIHQSELKERRLSRKRKEAETKRENERLEKQQTDSLQEYFKTQAGRVPFRPEQSVPVDSRDVNSFPALRVDLTHSNEDSDNTTEATVIATSPSGAWGAEVSSYSSVTSNMGLFPSLSQTTTPQNPHSSQSNNSPSRCTNEVKHSVGSPPQGAWNASSSSNTPTRLNPSSQEEPKQRKKSHGKTTILLSNAGPTYRR